MYEQYNQQYYQQYDQQRYKPLIKTQTEDKHRDLLKIGVLLLAFGIVGYAWVKISKAIATEIEG
jgi:hypothetical protein